VSRSLFIFVDSERPDAYLNVVVHCILFKDVRAVHFVHIQGLYKLDGESDADTLSRGLSGRVAANVQELLKALAERGQYFLHDPKNLQAAVPLAQCYGPEATKSIRQLYRRCRAQSVEYSNREMPYMELRRLLKQVAPMKDLAIIDITAIKKCYVGDIVVAALVEGVEGVYTFDPRVRPDFEHPWRMLIHDMLDEHEIPKHYQYVNIADTELYRNCARSVAFRAPRLALAIFMSLVAMLLATLMLVKFNGDGLWSRAFMGLSGSASIIALVLVFAPPRRG
jgi:hypothetical protein